MEDAASVLLDLALARPARLGPSRLVCIDGPAGSGKTMLAAWVREGAERRGVSVTVVHMDDVYAGWDGLADAGRRVREQIVEPISAGSPAAYERFDWDAGRYADVVAVEPAELLVVEGVGSGDPSYREQIGVLVWVWAPEELRLRRGSERDGPGMADHWRRWMTEEQQLHARDRTRERADVIVDGRTGAVSCEQRGA